MIDIFVPVLGRPDNAAPLVESVTENTTVDYSILFICSQGDDEQIEAVKQTGARLLIIKGGLSEYPRKMNYAFMHSARKYCLLAADDVEFQPGWDVTALRCAEETGKSVIGTDDCVNDRDFSPHCLVCRSYVEERGASLDGPGILCAEAYDHNYVDVELCKLAQARGEYAFCPESRICHRHHSYGTADKDETYAKGFRQFRRDRQKFMVRQRSFE